MHSYLLPKPKLQTDSIYMKTPTKPIKQHNKQHFNNVVENGFNFLESAFEEFESKPKYSVIHFSSAIELILKSRLIHEHWSLIVIKDADKQKFETGDFVSVGMNEAIERHKKVLGEELPKEAVECFKAIAQHRNRMIHFYHEAASTGAGEKLIEAIAREQCAGWFFLRRILESWGGVYYEYSERINALNLQMKGHQIYLQTVYDKISPEIEIDKKKGGKYRSCPSCTFIASLESELTSNISEYTCKVCLFNERLIKIDCPNDNCNEEITLDGRDYENRRCHKCDYEIENDELEGIISTSTDDYTNPSPLANCAYCTSQYCVIPHHDFYICLECLALDKEIAGCEWCNEAQIGGGDLEFSYAGGCEFCDGRAGHERD